MLVCSLFVVYLYFEHVRIFFFILLFVILNFTNRLGVFIFKISKLLRSPKSHETYKTTKHIYINVNIQTHMSHFSGLIINNYSVAAVFLFIIYSFMRQTTTKIAQ